jgi:hypothetical protein
MLHWQLNAPHRIENGDELSVSLTTEYFTWDIRKHVVGTSADGLLRRYLNPDWVPFPAKAGIWAGAKKLGLLRKEQERRHSIQFTLETSPRLVADNATP